MPTSQPIARPTRQPTSQPSRLPSSQPSRLPSAQPSFQPQNKPSLQPTHRPSSQPSFLPSSQPSREPSSQLSSHPSIQPSRQPTTQPSSQPSSQPSTHPQSRPTMQPTLQPTSQPSHQPNLSPTCQPSAQPSTMPSTSAADNIWIFDVTQTGDNNIGTNFAYKNCHPRHWNSKKLPSSLFSPGCNLRAAFNACLYLRPWPTKDQITSHGYLPGCRISVPSSFVIEMNAPLELSNFANIEMDGNGATVIPNPNSISNFSFLETPSESNSTYLCRVTIRYFKIASYGHGCIS